MEKSRALVAAEGIAAAELLAQVAAKAAVSLRAARVSYRFTPVGVIGELHRLVRPGIGRGAESRLDRFLPVTLPDERRDRTCVELMP